MSTTTPPVTAASFVTVFMCSTVRIANSRRYLSNGPQAMQEGARDLRDWREIAWKAVERKESTGALRRAILSLPIKYREVLFLRDVKDLDTEETAWILNVSAGEVRARLQRARMQVYDALLTSLFGRVSEATSTHPIFVERLWRTVKYENVYLHDYRTVAEAILGLRTYFSFYNTERQHQSLDYRTPQEV